MTTMPKKFKKDKHFKNKNKTKAQITLESFGIRDFSTEQAEYIFNKIFEDANRTGKPIELVAKEYVKGCVEKHKKSKKKKKK